MEYIIVALICFGLGVWYTSGSQDKLEAHLLRHLKQGRQVMIVIDDEATIYNKVGDNIVISQATTNIEEEDESIPYDLVSGVANQPFDSGERDVSNIEVD